MTSVGREPATTELAGRLLAAYFDELAARFPEGLASDPAHAARPDQLSPPGGAFLVVRSEGVPVGCGGLRRLDERTAEVKHMWIDPAARGRGLGRVLLSALEAEAAALGYGRVRLDTSRHLHEAAGLYRASGYHAIPAYNQNPYAAHWFEKELLSAAVPGLPSEPLPERALDDEQRRLRSVLTTGPRAGVLAAERSPTGWALPGPFGPMLLSPAVGGPLQELGAAVRYRGRLDDAARELAIVATAYACSCRYELDQHLPLARAAGVPEGALAATAAAAGEGEGDGEAGRDSAAGGHGARESGRESARTSPREAAIVRACRQLVRTGGLEAGFLPVLEAELGRPEAFELLVLAGYYRLLAGVLSAYGVG